MSPDNLLNLERSFPKTWLWRQDLNGQKKTWALVCWSSMFYMQVLGNWHFKWLKMAQFSDISADKSWGLPEFTVKSS